MKAIIGGEAGMVSWRALLVAGLACGLIAPGAAQARAAAQEAGQEAPPAKDEPAIDGAGNDIIVTATKREQTLQDIPVAVTVTTAEVIDRAKIRDIKDLSSVVPSLRVVDHQSSTQTDFLIRGFGNGANNAGIEPSVGVFIDGVYRSRSAAQIADFPDVRRVEVLRGPQSTLFGKNASAGVISIVTAAPQFKFGGNAELSYGNYNAVVVKGMVTGPVTDSLAVSLAGGYNRRDGWATTTDGTTSTDLNNRNRWFARGQMLFQPNTQLKVRLIADYGEIDERCCAVSNVLASAATGAIKFLGGNVNAANDPFNGTFYNNFPSTNKIKNYGFSGQIDYSIGPLTVTSITAWRKSHSVSDQDSDFTSLDILGKNHGDVGIRTFTQEFRAATNMEGPLNFVAGAYYFNEKINQQEQLLYGTKTQAYANALIGGLVPGQTLNSVTGALGSFATGGANPCLYFQPGTCPSLSPASLFYQAGTGLNGNYGMKNEAISVFGQVDFKVMPRLTLTAGVNYTHDRKNFDTTGTTSSDVFSRVPIAALVNGVMTANPALAPQVLPLLGLIPYQFLPQPQTVPNVVENGKTSDGNVSWTVRANFEVDNHIKVYASVATGFKASSINLSRDSRPLAADAAALIAAGLAAPKTTTIANSGGLVVVNPLYGSRFALPEKSTVYEAGFKGSWGTTSLNVAIFKESIENFQSNLFTGTGFILGNAGKESVWGVEAEGAVKPLPELTLTGSVTWLNPKYDSYVQSPFGDGSGFTPAGIAPVTLSLGGTWEHRFANDSRVILHMDWHYESPVQILDGLPGFIGKNPLTQAVLPDPAGYAAGLAAAQQFRRTVSEVNGSATYMLSNGLSLTVWARNLTDNRYFYTIFDTPLQSKSVSAYPNTPRTFGGSVSYKF